MNEEMAETVALQALGWLVADQELLDVFLGSTGASVEDLRANAGSRETALAVLDFLVMNDEWVESVSRAQNWGNDTVLTARAVLLGEAGMQWT